MKIDIFTNRNENSTGKIGISARKNRISPANIGLKEIGLRLARMWIEPYAE